MITERTHIDTYPYKVGEDTTTIRRAAGCQFNMLLEGLDLSKPKKQALFDFFAFHFLNVERLYLPEETERRLGIPRANLFYHLKDHGLYQAGYDAASITKTILNINTHLRDNLSIEGAIAIPIASIYHDIGYVSADPNTENYASLTPVHVTESMKAYSQALQQNPLPDFLDTEKAIRLGENGIHHTFFPHTEKVRIESNSMLKDLSASERKEAMIIRLSVQLADLGGQVARPDYYPYLVKDLRRELDASGLCSGLAIIGSDDELLKKAQNFSRTFVLPTVGKTANAFFGKENSFSKIWHQLLLISN